MMIYVVVEHFPYDAGEIRYVTTSKRKATAFYRKQTPRRRDFEIYEIKPDTDVELYV